MTDTIIILSAWFIFTFYGCIVAYIAANYNQQQQVNELAYAGVFNGRIDIDGNTEADRFISKLSSLYYGIYDFTYLKPYLTKHLAKYEYGRLPAQSGHVIYSGESVKYTLNFIDCQDIRILKYIKPVIRLLNESKHNKATVKRLNVLSEANQVLKSKRTRKVKELATV
jgi:hypothetical protein